LDEEERNAEKSGYRSEWQFDRRSECPRCKISSDYQRAANQSGGEDQRSMCSQAHRSSNVWHHQSYESD
jgi:hypothetical protein